MRSMTGYGRAIAALDGGTLTVQVSSVNRRMLDLTVKMPGDWESLETEIGERVRKVAARGKVHVDVEFSMGKGRDEAAWNETAVGTALDRLAALADARRIPFEPTAELLWQIANSQRTPAEMPTADGARTELLKALDDALRAFAAMRAREGEALFIDFIERIGSCRRQMDSIAARAPAVAPAYRAQLMKRLRDADLELDVEDERVLREVALFADRCDISEEITRFRSHLDQMAALLKSDEEIGRKADFILQEMGREANTVGSKANDLAISKAVIELKNELERVREQMANVE
ncbi:MAG TPA: YicC/YloC family endoribonuclease [Opitutaceae bacterium]